MFIFWVSDNSVRVSSQTADAFSWLMLSSQTGVPAALYPFGRLIIEPDDVETNELVSTFPEAACAYGNRSAKQRAFGERRWRLWHSRFNRGVRDQRNGKFTRIYIYD
jgi:hypothetical protein